MKRKNTSFLLVEILGSRNLTHLKTSKATTNTATPVSIHGTLDAENHEQMEVHQKIAEMKLQFQMVQFTRDDIE